MPWCTFSSAKSFCSTSKRSEPFHFFISAQWSVLGEEQFRLDFQGQLYKSSSKLCNIKYESQGEKMQSAVMKFLFCQAQTRQKLHQSAGSFQTVIRFLILLFIVQPFQSWFKCFYTISASFVIIGIFFHELILPSLAFLGLYLRLSNIIIRKSPESIPGSPQEAREGNRFMKKFLT